MKKKLKKNSLVVIMAVIIASITLTAGIVRAASLTVDSLTVGKQGVGGVTFFNGTIINNTTTNGANNPVTFGDNVRIDGYVYRGATAGTGDNKPFKINDNGEVAGNLTVGGNSTVKGNLTVNTIYFSNSKANISAVNDDTVYVNDNMSLHKDLELGGGLDVWGESKFYGYTKLALVGGQPPSADCANGNINNGRMKFDDSSWPNKLWVCGSGYWKSFSADVPNYLGDLYCSYGQIPQMDLSSNWKCVTNTDDSIKAFFDCISDESIGNENIKLSDWNSCKTKWVWW